MSRPVLTWPVALVAGPSAALLAAVPAALRVSAGHLGFFEALVAVAALTSLPYVALVGGARAGRVFCFKVLGGSGAKVLAGIAVFVLITLPVDAALGAALKATTHHRALGGATFAVLALVTNLVAALVSFRFVAEVSPAIARQPKGFSWVVGAALVAAIVLLALSAISIAGVLERAALLDGWLALAAIALALPVDIDPSWARSASLLGAAGLTLVLVLGLFLLSTSTDLRGEIRGQAPLGAALGQVTGLLRE
ncbi:MAG TPA: hypothetical protein VJT73_13165 [Polyangiaceae bacterium]|nr:hypothetical protein [Polyangiaceae bacterium]